MQPKQKFEFDAFDCLVDIYVDTQKIRDKHNGNLGHVYLHHDPVKVHFEVKPHDPRIPVVAYNLEFKRNKDVF